MVLGLFFFYLKYTTRNFVMSQPIVYGDAISTYVRSVRLGLEEKGVAHELESVDLIKGECNEPAFLARQPWGKMPAFSHEGVDLYETQAILRYIDEAFAGPELMPQAPAERARSNQVMSIVDSYGYPASVTNIFIPRVLMPMLGEPTDEEQIEAAKPQAALFLKELNRLLADTPFFGGNQLSLADLMVLPVLVYLKATPEGDSIIKGVPAIGDWIERMCSRDSVLAIMPPE
jgi:glutathione S-transferase